MTIAQKEVNIACHVAATARRTADVVSKAAPIMNRHMVMARANAKTNVKTMTKVNAKANANAKSKAKDEANARAKAEVIFLAITALHNLATDCLRLTMYFFYPIQQCAQQVYHSALPLSPISSELRKSCLQSITDNQISQVATFSGAPNTWGLLLRTIDIRPRQLTCVATSIQKIIATCGEIVNIYDAVTFVLRQSFCAPETVTKIQGSPDGSIMFFAHSLSVTMWDMQTGGLAHTFTVQSEINDIAVSPAGTHIACGLSGGSVAFWNINTKEGRGFGNDQPIVTICWLSPTELLVATRSSIYLSDITVIHTSNSLSIPGCVWGAAYLGGDKFLVGSTPPSIGVDQELCSLEIISHQRANQEWQLLTRPGRLIRQGTLQGRQPPMHFGQLTHPTRVGSKIVCITPPSGVRSFDTKSNNRTYNPPLLDAAMSVAVSLNRNLVVQTKDSIQIFSPDVLKTGEARDNVHPSHVYPLGEKHIICLQSNRNITLLELETLAKLRPDDDASPLRSLFTDQSLSIRTPINRGLVAEFGVSVIMQAWQSGTPLPEWREAADEDAPLSGLSPRRTRIITVYGPPRQELHVKDAEDGTVLANLSLEDSGSVGRVYDLTFDSETSFCLKVDGPGWHVQIPYDITASPSGCYSHTIAQGEPVPLSEPRAMPPYTLDANCEWVIDTKSRKICWISPGNIRRGSGGHFWVGLSLVMVGDDGVVRKLSFEEPDF